MDTSKRICALRRYMQENALDACVLMSPENMQYMSGFQAITYSRPIFFVITAETTYLIIPALEEAHADVTSTGVEHLCVMSIRKRPALQRRPLTTFAAFCRQENALA